MTTYLTVAAVAYLLGSIPFGYILVRAFLGADIRATGSGNIGATNVGRTGHRGLAIATLLLDAGKGAAAVLIAFLVFSPATHDRAHAYQLAALAALFVVAGHVFTVWLRFRGGKGVAAAVGAFAVLAPRAVLVSLLAFLVIVAITRFVSLGSIVAAIVFPVAVYFLPRSPAMQSSVSVGSLTMMSLTALLVISKHRQNIRRLLAGTENKLGAKAQVPSNPVQSEKSA